MLMPVEAGEKTNTLKVVIATEKATECAESNLFWHAEFGYPKIGTDAKWSRVPFASHRPGLEYYDLSARIVVNIGARPGNQLGNTLATGLDCNRLGVGFF